jgi:hypothetical protein
MASFGNFVFVAHGLRGRKPLGLHPSGECIASSGIEAGKVGGKLLKRWWKVAEQTL